MTEITIANLLFGGFAMLTPSGISNPYSLASMEPAVFHWTPGYGDFPGAMWKSYVVLPR